MNNSIPAFFLVMISILGMPLSAHSEGLGDLFGNAADSSSQSKFLPVDKAFKVQSSTTTHQSDATLKVQFDITPGHYVYKDKVKLTLPKGVSAGPFQFNQAVQFVDDPQFGRVAVFDQRSVIATATLTNSGSTSINNGTVTVGWQGCAKAGLCYPPEKIKTTVTLPAVDKSATETKSESTKSATATEKVTEKGAKQASSTTQPDNKATSTKASVSGTNQPPHPASATPQDKAAAATVEGADLAQETLTREVPDANQDQSQLTEDGVLVEGEPLDPTRLKEAQDRGTAEPVKTRTAEDQSQESLIDNDPFKLATHPWLALGLLFLAGLGLAFTPCVLPMLPIVANIVANQNNPTTKKSIILTSSYALGVAIAYGILGAVIAIFGQSLGIIGWLQNPVILISFAALFVFLALYMLELIPFRLPSAISRKLGALNEAGNSKLGSAGGSLIAGFLSALVVSPCVSAPLFGALLAVSTIGNPVLGFAALFMLGFGLSAPLILLGATQGSVMPKAGMWMNWVKQGFALLLFAVALLLIERVFVSPLMLLVWALWFMVVAVWAWQWRNRGRILTQALGLMAGGWALALIVGAALGNSDSLRPLASLNMNALQPAALVNKTGQDGQTDAVDPTEANVMAETKTITTLAELDKITASSPKVLVDVTADWCIECRIMDKALFASPPAALSGWQVVKLDITETTPESKAILSRYQLFGPPALLYYQNGRLVAQQVGETKRQPFVAMLTRLNSSG